MKGQLSIFDYTEPKEEPKAETKIEEPKDYSIKPTYIRPCDNCDIAFGSLSCFLRRGYMRDNQGKWCRDSYGNILITKNKECDYEPRDLNLQCFESWRDGNRVFSGKCPYFNEYDGINHCAECREYEWFWNQINELETKGYTLKEALQIVRDTWGIKSAYEYQVRSEEEIGEIKENADN